ncbi:MAG: LysM peptidoglycan-binding domain-containing protein [Desulfarculus sp.]|nr:LysM peptidoglycan-binding domain-containing protein [Desulfarculus sp.]
MNIRHCLLITPLVLALAGCATTGGERADLSSDSDRPTAQQAPAKRPSKAEIQARVVQELIQLGERDPGQSQAKPEAEGSITYDIPITINDQVEYFIDYFQTKIPKRFRLYLSRSTRYEAVMRGILKEYGLPEDLLYLALIESGFSCQAVSSAQAVGPWQFIKASGVRFGLKIDYYVDERQDPVKSTHAAAKYLRELYNEFGSWYLAAAAYNAGENKIRRALSRYQASDYWTISHHQRDYLANETKEYVPRMIAAALIAKEPAKYGFGDIEYEPPMVFDEIQVHPGVSLSAVAKAAGLAASDLANLNPELKHGATPPNGQMYTLRVPQGQADRVAAVYAQLSPAERNHRFGPAVVVAQKGDTLVSLARAHNMSLPMLASLNPRLNTKKPLRSGQRVIISSGGQSEPVRLASAARQPATTVLAPAAHNSRKIVHTVQKGDTLWSIAQTYNIDHKDIARWNGESDFKLMIGQQLALYIPQAKAEAKVETKTAARVTREQASELTYQVRKGDTLGAIAKRFNVNPGDLKRWNKLRGDSLSIGDKLTVRKERNS